VKNDLKFIVASKEKEFSDGVILFKEYANSLNISLAFQNFEKELKDASAMYGLPHGMLIVVYDNLTPIACAAFRKIEEDICEIKRMYVKPSYRRMMIADKMMEILIENAIIRKYKKIRLDTLDTMTPAISLYRKFGFFDIPAYYFNPNTNTVYMEKILSE